MGDFCEKKGVPCIFVEEHHISVCQPNEMVKKIFYDFLHVGVIPTVSFAEATDKEIIQMTPFITEEEEREIRPSIPTCETVSYTHLDVYKRQIFTTSIFIFYIRLV